MSSRMPQGTRPGRADRGSRRLVLNAPGRLAGIDLARGLAIVGMLAAHLLATPEEVTADPSTWIAIVDGRSSILFATLAGVSIALFTGGRKRFTGPRMAVSQGRLAVRAVMLWVLGILLISTGVPVYVILPAYALLFLIAIPLAVVPTGWLAGLAVVLALGMPWLQPRLDEALAAAPNAAELAAIIGWHYPFTTWIAFVVAGLALGRTDLARTDVQAIALGIGLAAMGVGYGLAGAVTTTGDPMSDLAAVWTAEPHSSGLLEVVGSGGFAIAVIAACQLVCRRWVSWVVLPLRAAGSMPLTAYTAQIVVWAVWSFAAVGDTRALAEFRALEPFWPITIGVLVGCTAWSLVLGRGPLERVTAWTARRLGPEDDGIRVRD